MNLKIATANGIMVANAFVWYLVAFNGLKSLLSQQNVAESTSLFIFGVNVVSIAVAGLLATLFVGKIKNRKLFLYLWLAGGIALSVVPLALNWTSVTDITIIAALFGGYFGLGMPATMGYHSGLTRVEDRAKIGGLTFLIIALTFVITSLFALDSFFIVCLLLAATRILGFVFFHVVYRKEEPAKDGGKVKYSSILANRSFILYFIPWGMFTLINFTTLPIQQSLFPPEIEYGIFVAIENAITAIVAVISGLIADKFGRKRLIIVGFVMLGIGYAFIGLTYPSNLLFGSMVYAITDGAAWGIFYVLFLFTIWGDLAQARNSDKFFFLGALPYVSAYFLQILFTPYLVKIDVSTIFSFASVFLFIAVLPLIYAPETLPEKVLKDRDLKTYLEKAQKIAKKETEKTQKKEPEKEPEENEEAEPEANNKEYDEARKLAEKYY